MSADDLAMQGIRASARSHGTDLVLQEYFEGILPKGPYLPCVSMAGRAFWQDIIDVCLHIREVIATKLKHALSYLIFP